MDDIVYIPLPKVDPDRWEMTPIRRSELNAEGLELLAIAEEISRTSVLESGDSPRVVEAANKYLKSIGA